MIFLIVLATGTLIAAAAQAMRRCFSPRQAARIGLAVAMVVAGIAHWVRPLPFLQHLPPWVPAPEFLILATGIAEVVLGAALFSPQPWRRRAGMTLAAYLIAVFPANVYVAVAGVDVDGQPGGVYPWLRLPLQVLFVAWALWSTRSEPRDASRHRGPTRGSSMGHQESIRR
jgi:uncharacterized membrane protein